MLKGYENQRIAFDQIVKKYNDYVNLYLYINQGSKKGLAPFHEFYWRLVYWSQYSDLQRSGNSGY